MQTIRPVIIGLILGIVGLMFGIFWAAYLTVNHERIHRTLAESARASLEEKFVISEDSQGHNHGSHDPRDNDHGEAVHSHAGKASAHSHEEKAAPEKAEPVKAMAEEHKHPGEHDDSAMEAAHERLTRGHIHAMGLGLVAIGVSFVLAFVTAPYKVKTFASACLGVGGLFYPFAWIIMGYRTVALGLEASQESVFPIVAFSVALVFAGLFITLFYLIMEVFRRH